MRNHSTGRLAVSTALVAALAGTAGAAMFETPAWAGNPQFNGGRWDGHTGSYHRPRPDGGHHVMRSWDEGTQVDASNATRERVRAVFPLPLEQIRRTEHPWLELANRLGGTNLSYASVAARMAPPPTTDWWHYENIGQVRGQASGLGRNTVVLAWGHEVDHPDRQHRVIAVNREGRIFFLNADDPAPGSDVSDPDSSEFGAPANTANLTRLRSIVTRQGDNPQLPRVI